MRQRGYYLGLILLLAAFWVGCAPSEAYQGAGSLRKTAAVAGEASRAVGRQAKAAEARRTRMVKDVESIKAAERLFDEQSNVILSY